MIDRSHVTRAVEEEIKNPLQSDDRAADMVFAALSTALVGAAQFVAPAAGPVAAACLVVQANHMRKHYDPKTREWLDDVVDAELACRDLSDAPECWREWIPWEDLVAGAEVDVPKDLDHPRDVGFRPTLLAAYRGQAADWARPLPDGSRLHAHEYADGAVTLHRDRLDPARGPAVAAMHWLSETPEGAATGIITAALLVSAAVWAVGST